MTSLQKRYADEVERGLARVAALPPAPIVSEADLAGLPPRVAAYFRRAGVVGQPRPRALRAAFHGRMRQAPDAPWMDVHVEQHNFFDAASRFFLLRASRAGIPFTAYHRYEGAHATFEVRAAGLFRVVDARGAQMDQSETVTMLNDLCFLAPAALLDAQVAFEGSDDQVVRATFTNAGHTVRADLTFDAGGDLVDFLSLDRYQNDGKTSRLLPWRTPVAAYGDVDGHHAMKRADARWVDPAGEWAYIELELDALSVR